MVRNVGIAPSPHGWFKVSPDMHGRNYMDLAVGKYEAPEIRLLKSHFKTDHTIVEVGAHIGVVSRATIREKLTSNGTYIAIEPDPRAAIPLWNNIFKPSSPDGQTIKVLNQAVGSPAHDGQHQVFNLKNNLSSGLLAVNTPVPTEGQDSTNVLTVSLSSIVDGYCPDGYSLICDSEGGEILILRDDPDALTDCRQILIELHHPSLTGHDITPDDMVGMIENLGFEHRAEAHNTHYFTRPQTLSL